MSRMRRSCAGLAAVLAGIYLTLAVFSVACSVEHAQPRPSSHHHGSTVSHSNFCSWACQANPTSDAGATVLVLHPFLVVAVAVEHDHTVVAGSAGFQAASRAPPVQS